jgi:hypothetical protein
VVCQGHGLVYCYEVFWVKDGLPEGNISDEDMRKLQEASDIFVGAVHNMLSDHLFYSMMYIKDAKVIWNHLNATYGASDTGKELYIMEQAHEIQRLAKELELLKCVLPDEFVAGCIIVSCLLHGGISPQVSNTRDIKY